MYGYLIQFIYLKKIIYYSARNKSILYMKQYIIIRLVTNQSYI